jgi:hypothetical protein
MAEIAFESLAMALEGTTGTAETAPTSFMNLAGTLEPVIEYYEPDESSGLLAARMRTKQTRKYGNFDADGPLDPNTLIEFLSMIAKGGVTPAQPGAASDTYDWDFSPTMDADDLKFATLWWGDPNMTHVLRGKYGFIDSLTIASDASGIDGATLSISGMTNFPEKVTPPTYPDQAFAPLIAGVNMQLYLDTTSAIGTTAVTGRVVSAQHVLESGITPKYVAAGPTADLSYSRHGRGKRGMVTSVVMEIPDYAQYDIAMLADTVAKLRVVHNGAFIETDSVALYYGVTVDTYGVLRFGGWGELEGTNRTATFEVHSEYNAGAGVDWAIKVRNKAAALAA